MSKETCGYIDSLTFNDYLDNYITSKVKNNYSFTYPKHNKTYTYYNPIYAEHYCDDCNVNTNDSFIIKLLPPDMSLINKSIIQADKIIDSHFKEISEEAIKLLNSKISRSKSQDDKYKMGLMINSSSICILFVKKKINTFFFVFYHS